MSLGSIAHLQHYFARTGLLDGKGGQLYHGKIRKKPRSSDASSSSMLDRDMSELSLSSSPAEYGSPDMMMGASRASSEERSVEDLDPMMLPPTASTYHHRPKHVPPPPDLEELRGELRRTLMEARKILQDTALEEEDKGGAAVMTPNDDNKSESAVTTITNNDDQSAAEAPAISDTEEKNHSSSSPSSPSPGWTELQGLTILDSMTLAIRAAKMYYTAHEQPARLASYKSERKLREELLGVLDTLKRMAMRNFAGGIRPHERTLMLAWIDGVQDLLTHEEGLEQVEQNERLSWRWMQNNTPDEWTGPERARERAWLFLCSFDPVNTSSHSSTSSNGHSSLLPKWTPTVDDNDLPTPFLSRLQSGLKLVQLHNEMVRKSRKPFGQITVYHTDTMKPYRCAENLRYWIKAAELRWDVVLKIDVLGVVYGRGADVWKRFEEEVLRWCDGVREGLVAEWNEKRVSVSGASSGTSGTVRSVSAPLKLTLPSSS